MDYQATLEPQTEKAIKLEKEALAQIKEITKENAHLVSNLYSNLGGLYRTNGQLDLDFFRIMATIYLIIVIIYIYNSNYMILIYRKK